MKINKLSFYGAMIAAASFCSTMAFAGVHHRADNNPPPPPPRGELHERLCEGGNCCNLDVDGRSLNYTLRCDHPFKEAELTVGNRRPEVFRLYEKGRLQREIEPQASKSIHLIYPPKREIHTRLCDRDNCCSFDVNGRSGDYTLRCDRPIERAKLTVNKKMSLDLREQGRLNRDVFDGDHLDITLIYPPKRDLHKRLCDRDNCCNLDVDGNGLDYTLRCDHPFKDADLYIGKHRPEQMRIYDRGRLSHEIKQNEHLELRINYAPPPPPPHNPHARDLNNKHRR